MAELGNVYDALAEEKVANRQTGLDYSKIREGGVAAAVMAQAGGMLGGAAMEAAGYQTPAQVKQQARQEVQAMFPNPTTYSEMVQMANAFKNLGQMDDYQQIMKMANDMTDSSTTKKWQAVRKDKREDIRKEAERRNYLLTEDDISAIANSSPDVAQVSATTDTFIHPWMNALENRLSQMKQDPGLAKVQSAVVTPSSQPTDLTSDKKQNIDTKALESMNTQFTGETKNLKENISTIETGINIVNQVRNGNTAAMPQMERILAKFNSDKRISNPEVQQVMKIGGLGQRIANSISRFISGDTSAQTLNDIEEMLVRIGQLDQEKYNSKVDDYTSKYENRYDKDTLSKWIRPSTAQFFTTAQKLELARQELKRRGK